MSMKNGTVTSGDISLQVSVTSPTPTLMLNADFLVKVPNNDEPLKFSGGLSINDVEAKLFIALASQWWINPFGLSLDLHLGPDLALQLGIIYASPVYPSEVGVTAGLTIGSVTGKAALSVSDSPNDEIIVLRAQNLGIRDIIDFASKLLQTKIPDPGQDFLRFKEVDLYLSTGVTLGATTYPPGASFSCDAIVFGTEATVSYSASKSTGQNRS